MHAYWLTPSGSALELEKREQPVPAPGAGQVLVRMHAVGLNRGELLPGAAGAKAAAKAAGTEGAGTIEALGAGVDGPAVGTRVMGRCGGAFAEFALMDAREVIPMPERLSFEEAASIPITFAVVHDMLLASGRLAAGEWLLVTGVTSGVGVAALQVARALGAKVIGTSGSSQKLERLKPLGLDLGLHTRAPEFHQSVLAETGGKGANLAVNTVGGSVFAECVRALAYGGRLAIVGYVDRVLKAEFDLEAVHAKRLHIYGVSNRLRPAAERAAGIRAFVADLMPAIADGRIQPLIDKVFDFADLPAAKAYMESDAHVGKIVARLPV